MNSEKSYSVSQVAKKLGVTPNAVGSYCRSGKIKATKIPRPGLVGFKYLIEGDDFLRLLDCGPITRGPQGVKGTRLGPFEITRLTNGDLVTVRV